MQERTGVSATVTSLIPYLTQSSHPVMTELLAYWEHLRAGRIAPLRSEVVPRDIENILEHAFILEEVPDQAPRIRIAGMSLCTLMGMEIRSMPATALISPPCRSQFMRLLQGLFKHPEILEIKLENADPKSGFIQAEMMLLPMQASPGDVSRLLGCLVASGSGPRKPPVRFEIKTCKHTRIVATSGEKMHHSITGFAEPAEPFITRPAPALSRQNGAAPRSYLHLIETDE